MDNQTIFEYSQKSYNLFSSYLYRENLKKYVTLFDNLDYLKKIEQMNSFYNNLDYLKKYQTFYIKNNFSSYAYSFPIINNEIIESISSNDKIIAEPILNNDNTTTEPILNNNTTTESILNNDNTTTEPILNNNDDTITEPILDNNNTTTEPILNIILDNYVDIFYNISQNDIIEDGIYSESERFILNVIEKSDLTFAISILSKALIKYYDDEIILVSILNIISGFNSDTITEHPFIMPLVISSLKNKNIFVQEQALKIFYNCGNRKFLNILENLEEFNNTWLNIYKKKIIDYLKSK